MPLTILLVYCVLIFLASLAGGWLPLLIRLTHARMQIVISAVAGIMLGVGLMHMLPHAIFELGIDRLDRAILCLLAGFLTMFLVERFFCFHHHDVPDDVHQHGAPCDDVPRGDVPCDDVPCDDVPCDDASELLPLVDRDACDGGRDCDVRPDCHGAHELTWGGAAVGLTLHSLLAGVALAAAVRSEWDGQTAAVTAGVGTFLVIFLHKPFDSLTLGTLLALGPLSRRARHTINVLFALAAPLGALAFFAGVDLSGHGTAAAAYGLAFSAGTFLCIAMSDLLPELQFHSHDRVKLSVALFAGLVLAWAIGLLEPGGHDHGHSEHDHAGHVEVEEPAEPGDAHDHGHADHED